MASRSPSSSPPASPGASPLPSTAAAASSPPAVADTPASPPTPAAKRPSRALPSEYAEDTARRGVVYLSRVPPGLKPAALRELLTPFGTVERIYLRPEGSAARSARTRGGGSRRSRFTDGWVEFSRARAARRTADLLNGAPMGAKKRSPFHDDLWTLRYLRGFRWADLTDADGDARRERTNRVRAEVAAGRREKAFYLAKADTAAALEGMARKKRRRVEAAAAAAEEEGGGGEQGGLCHRHRRRRQCEQRRGGRGVRGALPTARRPAVPPKDRAAAG
ncbi:hypothetical protein BU14_0070s0025 [Porphyra umbilicalis]|uniref:RRM domain-containing protein n=1 Tax=Porphyra umbilicalis TaxID=2786 RepID=A0A1X6PG77_PORUM|nr:hypothetical protein BU14_0070s0025 [Porphyra umbilicalis]|eukprot:OSX79850.1 hypothetical protein BU14_0070s0025 [Porphyra umbilicalis]